MEAIVIKENRTQSAAVSQQLRDSTSEVVDAEIKGEQMLMAADMGDGVGQDSRQSIAREV